MKTRERILRATLDLLNKSGIQSVTIQEIANSCNISVGNLAYHFHYKEDLITEIADRINAEIGPVVDTNNSFPLLIDFDNQLSRYYNLINKYAFFFLDVLELERTYPKIHKQRVRFINMMIDQIYQWIKENSDKGTFQPEIHPDQYAHTAHAIWMTISFWLTQKKVLSTNGSDEEKFKIVVWNQLLPNFTNVGLMEYEALILPQLRDIELILNL